MAHKQRFCSTRHRIYYNREGGAPVHKDTAAAAGDTSLGAAVSAVMTFTAVEVPGTKAAQSIRVQRPRADPNGWAVAVPQVSSAAAAKVRDALLSRAGDLVTLANKLTGDGEERVVLRSMPARKS
jgi:hypothetical protein